MKVFILLSVVAVALASHQCGENQHYESCGTACPLTCDNYDNPPRACVLMCNPGCHCDEGYVKTEDGRCVRPEECPASGERFNKVCSLENEHYESCGTACPLTCDNYKHAPLPCIKMCNPGCHCIKGYVRSHDGRCVRPEQCPASSNPVLKTCLAKPDTGMCKAYFPMWYYNVQTGKCHEFIYGGCQGNGNRYATEEECMEHCSNIRLKEASVNKCELPAETGNCRGFFPRFYFDKKTGQCQKFVYGGCGGNENNFVTLEDCNQACAQQQASSEEQCELPAVSGPCRGFFQRYYFDKKTGQCETFVYGGCGGNENNFESEEVCNQVCGVRRQEPTVNQCHLPAETGPCRALFHRYSFNKATGKCEKFVYGGCRGNENNFETIEDCQQTCA